MIFFSLPLSYAFDSSSEGVCLQWYEEGRTKKKRTVDGEERGHRLPHFYIKLSTPVPSVAETATQKSEFLVMADAVQNTDVTYGTAELSFKIDGCQ